MASPSKLAHRGLVTLLAGAALAAQAALVLQGGHGGADLQPALLPVTGMGILDSAVAAVLALVLAYGTDGEHGTHALAVCLAAWGYILAYSGVVALVDPPAGLARTVFEAHFPLVEMLGLAGAMRFSAVFPSPVSPGDFVPADALGFGLRALQRGRRAMLTPAGPWLAALAGFAALLGVNALAGGMLQEAPLNPFAALMRFTALTVVVLNFRVSWIRSRGVERKRMLWMIAGLTLLFAFLGVLVGGNVLLAVTGWRVPLVSWSPIVLDLSLLSLFWGMAMAVYRGGDSYPDRLAGRAALLGGAVTAGLFLAAGLEGLFSDVFVARATVPHGLGTALALVLTTLAYRRMRPGLEGSLARVWAGDAADPLD